MIATKHTGTAALAMFLIASLAAIGSGACAAPGSSPSAATGDGKKDDIITFSLHSSVYGPCRAHVSKTNMRFEWGMIIMILKPPDYEELFMINPGNKCYRPTTITDFFTEKWKENKLNPRVKGVRKAGTLKLHGYNCQRYVASVDGVETAFATSDDFKIDPRLNRSCCRILGVPPGYGTPVSAIRYYRLDQKPPEGRFVAQKIATKRRRQVVMLVPWLTVDSIKKSRLDHRELEVPPGFKATDDDFALWFTDGGKMTAEEVEDFFMSGPRKRSAGGIKPAKKRN